MPGINKATQKQPTTGPQNEPEMQDLSGFIMKKMFHVLSQIS